MELDVYYDCQYDNLTRMTSLPANQSEDPYGMMVLNMNEEVVVSIMGEILQNVVKVYEVDLRQFIPNNASTFCTASYDIDRVIDNSTGFEVNKRILGTHSYFN